MPTPIDHLRNPAQQQRSAYPFWMNEHVRWCDTDMAGHANNLAFIAFLETGRARLLQRFVVRDAAQPALLVMAELRLRFLAEAHWPDEVEVGTSVVSIGTRSCVMLQGLFVGDRCIAVGETVLVNIDTATRQSTAIPDAVKALLLDYAPRAIGVTA